MPDEDAPKAASRIELRSIEEEELEDPNSELSAEEIELITGTLLCPLGGECAF